MGKQEIFVPDGMPGAIERTTHLCIAAHHDDAEILGYHGVLECFNKSDKWFGTVIVTDGAGSAREGAYKDYTDEQMKEIRIKEQKKAAYVGEYGFLKLLNYTSAQTKSDDDESMVKDLQDIILQAQPEVIYTHNPADKHATHIGVVKKVIKALQNIPANMRPKKVYGSEVWRDLDWLDDSKKEKLIVDAHLNLERALLGVFDSQITGGKRYDLATEGRRTANATYADSHSVDSHSRMSYAMDLMPVVNGEYTLTSYVEYLIDDFKSSVLNNLKTK